ncbi:Hypothetical predicted protein [Podarcis lilfordi]|uniref:Uncharacterized protein n=1 Tax=Podarcis lilfordi TaxID=74358 RepID=A0AA35PMX3_9SAUR|nr:Hypothetical predicted protein [Podarcis lilfordi]
MRTSRPRSSAINTFQSDGNKMSSPPDPSFCAVIRPGREKLPTAVVSRSLNWICGMLSAKAQLAEAFRRDGGSVRLSVPCCHNSAVLPALLSGGGSAVGCVASAAESPGAGQGSKEAGPSNLHHWCPLRLSQL